MSIDLYRELSYSLRNKEYTVVKIYINVDRSGGVTIFSDGENEIFLKFTIWINKDSTDDENKEVWLPITISEPVKIGNA